MQLQDYLNLFILKNDMNSLYKFSACFLLRVVCTFITLWLITFDLALVTSEALFAATSIHTDALAIIEAGNFTFRVLTPKLLRRMSI